MKKLLLVLALLLALGALGLFAAFQLGGPRLLAYAIRSGAAALGYQDVRVDVSDVGLGRTTLARISAGPAPGLEAEGITLDYDWATLLRARFQRVGIASVTLHGRWDEDGMVFPALPPPSAGPFIAVPAWEHLEVERGAVRLGGERGPVTVSFADFKASAAPGARLTARGIASIDSQATPLDAEFDLALDGERLYGNARVHSRDGSLDLRGDFGSPGEGPGRFPTLERAGQLRIGGRISVKAKEADLSPFAPAFTAKGNVDLGTEHERLQIRSDGLQLSVAGVSLQGLSLSLDLDQLSPPIAGAGQQLSVETAQMGVPIGGGSIRFGVRPSGVIELEALDWRLYGGILHTAAEIDPSATHNELVLSVRDLDLGRLVAGLEREDLEVTGIVQGELPLRLEGDRIFADGGRLTASEAGGVIRYGSREAGASQAPDAPPGSGEAGGMGLVLDALENFHYRTLEVEVDGELSGELNLKVKLEGSNPDLYDGYPFQLNLNLEGPLAAVVRGSQTGFRVQDAVEKRFQKRMEKR